MEKNKIGIVNVDKLDHPKEEPEVEETTLPLLNNIEAYGQLYHPDMYGTLYSREISEIINAPVYVDSGVQNQSLSNPITSCSHRFITEDTTQHRLAELERDLEIAKLNMLKLEENLSKKHGPLWRKIK